MKEEYEIDIDIDTSTAALLGAIANAEDDPLLLATLADISAVEFREFFNEFRGERTSAEWTAAEQLLRAAEKLDSFRIHGRHFAHETPDHYSFPTLPYLLIGGGIAIALAAAAERLDSAKVQEREPASEHPRHYSSSTRMPYLLVGGGIGAILALLFAPKSGKELRNDIADATRRGIDRSREAMHYVEARERLKEAENAAREATARQTGTVAAAIDAGRKAYQEEKRKIEISGAIEGFGKHRESSNS